MNICFIGKYPPIEGGVSMQSYWTVRALAERGHELYVVTNADEVEDAYRLYLDDDDREWYEPRFSQGFVKVRNSERFSPRKMSYIPVANPFVTKLASIAAQTIRQYDCEAIFASYFEPYGMAGHLASQWTGIPYVIRHAGSDLDRLMKVPDLSTAYKEILKGAARVLTRRGLVERFIRMGVKEDKIRADLGFSLPPELFNPAAAPMDVNGFLERQVTQTPARKHEGYERPAGPFDLSKPTIGIYGKVGEFKGSYDLLSALALLKKEGLDFNFLAMTHGWQGEKFSQAIREHDLAERTWMLPFIPHWKVPGFIRACTAVCFLERDFPILIHGPTIPREIIACGICLVISGEIASKQYYRDQIVDQENMLVVADPKVHEDLAVKLRLVIQQPELARQIGMRGHEISQTIEDFPAFAQEHENLFLELTGRDTIPVERRLPKHGDAVNHQPVKTVDIAEAQGDWMETMVSILPCTSFLLSEQLATVLSQHRAEDLNQNDNRLQSIVNFCHLLETLIEKKALGPVAPYFKDVFKFEKTQLLLSVDSGERDRTPPFSGVDMFMGQVIDERTIGHLSPLRTNYCRIEQFGYDINKLLSCLQQKESPPEPLPDKQTLLLFHTTTNFARSTSKINIPTRDLLDLCDGSQTTQSLFTKLAQLYGLEMENDVTKLKRDVLATLRELYNKGIIIFC
jgi:glycosyltransferase involved in cell wall biosynthesis